MEEANWPTLRDAYFGEIPALIRPLIAKQIRKSAFAAMRDHGLGRHTRSQIYELGAADLLSLSRFLGDKPFFMGDTRTSADATLYAWLSSILDAPLESPLKDAARGHANLVGYTQRVGASFFG